MLRMGQPPMSHNRRSSPPAAVAPSASHPFTSRFSPELARILRRGRDLLEGPGVVAHDFVLLEGQGSRVPRPDPGTRVVEHDNPAAVGRVYARAERQANDARSAVRLRRGFRFFELSDLSGTAGYGWFGAGEERYFDELALRYALPKDALWVRDVFVAPSRRGRGYFGGLLAHVIRAIPERPRLWSDVDWDNVPSLRAHVNVGFELRARLMGVTVRDRLVFRVKHQPNVLPATGFRAERRVVCLRTSELPLHRDLIA